MTPADFLTALAGLRPEWGPGQGVYGEMAEGLPHVEVAGIGQQVVEELAVGTNEDRLEPFFRVVERALEGGDAATRDLVVVGLFEAMQSANYRIGPPDAVERRLGPKSALAWADLIEAWTGPGVRTMAAW